MHYDYLILGSGIAGLYAALLASQHGRTAVVTKGPIEESNTKYAQGGIAAAVGPGDSVARHRQDTLTAGAGLCDPEAVDVLVREAPDRIRRLTELGVPFDSDEGRVALGREGAHSRPRILHAGGDRTGDAIETVMVRRVGEAGVDVFDRHAVTSLRIEAGRVAGVEALDPDGRSVLLNAPRTILATGGAGQLYTLTTNPAVATGDGVALAWRAGAVVRDMEFVQFHPRRCGCRARRPSCSPRRCAARARCCAPRRRPAVAGAASCPTTTPWPSSPHATSSPARSRRRCGAPAPTTSCSTSPTPTPISGGALPRRLSALPALRARHHPQPGARCAGRALLHGRRLQRPLGPHDAARALRLWRGRQYRRARGQPAGQQLAARDGRLRAARRRGLAARRRRRPSPRPGPSRSTCPRRPPRPIGPRCNRCCGRTRASCATPTAWPRRPP